MGMRSDGLRVDEVIRRDDMMSDRDRGLGAAACFSAWSLGVAKYALGSDGCISLTASRA